MLKRRKWYPSNIHPDKYNNLIIMTDMGWIFQGGYKDGIWYKYTERNYKMYLEPMEYPGSIIKWMKV